MSEIITDNELLFLIYAIALCLIAAIGGAIREFGEKKGWWD